MSIAVSTFSAFDDSTDVSFKQAICAAGEVLIVCVLVRISLCGLGREGTVCLTWSLLGAIPADASPVQTARAVMRRLESCMIVDGGLVVWWWKVGYFG